MSGLVDLWQDSVWSSMTVWDLLDILLIWLLAYRTFVILRGTAALQSLVGLLGLGLLYMASQAFELTGLGWLLEKFFVYIVIAVLILFQKDIRRGLARAGGRFFTGFTASAENIAHEEVVQAAFSLASRRIGALIVIERGASLGELIDGGHRVDAEVSQDLIMAIFHPTSPLHDGAIVLQGRRLVAAKCMLPLSLTKEIARYFGTRHRAALGLSEETDALVVVVSEERGAVSLVLQGALTPVEDANELREQLQQQLAADRGSKS